MNLRLPTTFKIETERFELRIPNMNDLPFVFSATKYPGFNDGMLWDAPETETELIAPLQRTIKSWNEGHDYSFTIVEKITNKFIGRISVRKTTIANVWDVGFWTHPDSQGKGAMTTCLSAIVNFAFCDLQAISVEADHAVWNKASERVLLKNGFKFIKYIEKGFQKNGKWIDENKVALSRDEWKNMSHSL